MSEGIVSLVDTNERWESYKAEADSAGRHDPYLLEPFPTPLDEALYSVVTGFQSMADSDRRSWPGSIPFSIRDSQILLTYAARMATQVLREGSTSRLTDGLVAHLIEGERDDWRENVIVLTLLFDAARKLGVDPLPIFDHVASLAAGDAAAETLGGFRKRKPEMLTIESMGYRTAMSAQGVRYEPDPAVWRQ